MFYFVLNRDPDLISKLKKKELRKKNPTIDRIITMGICALCDELFVFFNLLSQNINKQCKNAISRMTYDDFDDEDGRITKRFALARIKIKIPGVDGEQDVKKAYSDLLQELYSPDFEAQLSHLWKPVIEYMLPGLGPEWEQGLADSNWDQLLLEYLGIEGHSNRSNNKFQFRILWMKLLLHATLAVYAAMIMAALYHPDIFPFICVVPAWNPKLLLELLDWLILNWNNWFPHFWCPFKFLKIRVLISGDVLGLRVLLLGFAKLHTLDPGKDFKNLQTFLKAVANLTPYRANSQLNTIKIPKFISKFDTLMNAMWNENDDKDHLCYKITSYGIPFICGIRKNNNNVMKLMYGKAKYKNNNGLNSDLVRSDTIAGGIQQIFSNFINECDGVLDRERQVFKDNINMLYLNGFDYRPKYLLGISKMVRCAAEGLSSFLFKSMFNSFFFCFWLIQNVLKLIIIIINFDAFFAFELQQD